MYKHGTTVVRGLTLVEALDTRRNEVWRARVTQSAESHGIDTDVAVKLLHPAYDPILPRRHGRRHRTLRRVVGQGANWVRVLDHGYTTDGRRYITSPLHRGSLDNQLEHGPTPWFPAANLIAQAAAIVATAHHEGYSFGYLRPSSVLLDDTHGTHVAAYGMSTRRFDDGSAQFMAPELSTGTTPGPACDVFSLSLILASLIAGRAIDHREPADSIVDEIAGSAPARIREIIDYGLSIHQRNRFADAAKLAGAISSTLQEQVIPGPRTRSKAPRDAVDPLTALLAGPLVHSTGTESVRDVVENPVDRRVLDLTDIDVLATPDDVPTAPPFDQHPIEIDDPTDPGIAAPWELDTVTDHFGSIPHIEGPADHATGSSPGPLCDLLTPADDGDDGHADDSDG